MKTQKKEHNLVARNNNHSFSAVLIRTLFATSLLMLMVIFCMFGAALESPEYIQTDKEVYYFNEIVTIHINSLKGTYMEIDTPTVKYSVFGEPGSYQKFMPAEEGIYKIVLLDDENILDTKYFSVVPEGYINSNENLSDIYQSELSADDKGDVDVYINNNSAGVDVIYEFINNASNNSGLLISEGSVSENAKHVNGESLISIGKKIYSEKEIVSITIYANKGIEEIEISSGFADYFLMPEGDWDSGSGIRQFNFIPEKEGSYVVSVKLENEDVYYDVYFFVKNDALSGVGQKYSDYNDSLTNIYSVLNEGVYYKNMSVNVDNSLSAIVNLSVESSMSAEKIRIIDSKGELVARTSLFYKENPANLNVDDEYSPSYDLIKYESVSEPNLIQFDKYYVEISPEKSSIKKIKIKDYVHTARANIGLDEFPKDKYRLENRNVVDAYAINLDGLLFTEAIATVVAKGEELWKCAEWNFTEQQCYGSWQKIRDIIPGQEYNLLLYPGDPGYLETYSTFQSIDIDMIALDNNTIVMAWVDNATNYNISFQVWNVNGTALTSKIPVDATGGSTSRVSLVPINSSYFILSIFDQPQNNIDFFIYDRTGNSIVGRTNIAATVGAYTDVSICQLGDRFPVAYSRTSNGDAELRIYYNNGTLGTGTVQIDNNMAPELASQQLVSCSAINRTAFVYSWFDDNSNDMTFYMMSNTGTAIGAQTDYDTNVGETAQVASTSLGNNMFATVYYDSTDDDITINVRRVSGTSATSIVSTDIDTNAGTSSRVSIATILMETVHDFAVAWFDTSDNTIKAAVYNQTGSQVAAPFNVTTTPNVSFPMVAVAGYEPVINSGLCNGTFVVAYTNRTGGSLINKYWYNGSAWDGVCPDYEPPVVNLSEPGNDSNITLNSVLFSFTGTDARSSILDNCSIWANFTGTWGRNSTIYNITSGSSANISVSGLNDGKYIWNVNCYDNASNGAFAVANYTLRINNITPWILGQAINSTLINQSEKVRFNVTITDYFGINNSIVTLRYPNMTEVNYTLNNLGVEYYYTFSETVQLGTYYITLIWAIDNLSQESYNSTLNLQFNVTPSPPSEFNLTSPYNNTESKNLMPTFVWTQTTEPNFANYTLIISKESSFDTVNFAYATYAITNTTFSSLYALDANAEYYWKVMANDVFGNQKNSTQIYTYITDTIGPDITLNGPNNNAFWTNPEVLFNYTPTDTNTIQSCTLYGNFTGSFNRNTTNTTVIEGQDNYFNLTLAEGVYLWTVYCNDTALNGKYASMNNTFFLDLSGPSIALVSPDNNGKENQTNNVVFRVNASDKYANISSCSLIVNDTVERTVYSVYNGIVFNFTNFLLNGNYTWKVNCTDTNGITSSSETRNLTVNVIDFNPPLVTLNYPGSGKYVQSNNIIFNYTPEDATGLSNCSIYIDGIYNITNTTKVVNFVYNYFSISGLTEGMHTWRITCYDNSTELNYGTSSTRIFYVDTIRPNVTLIRPGNSTSEDSWFYPSEEYRKKHNITGLGSANLTNYTVNIIVHYGEGIDSGKDVYLNYKSKTDFGDVRFTDGEKNEELSYYIENVIDSDSASFWIKQPLIDSINGSSFYIYYGDGGLSTTSSGEDTFEFFDDFSNGLDKWIIDSENTDAIMINSSAGISGPGVVHYPDSSQTKNAYYDTRMITRDYNVENGVIDYDIYIAGTSRAIHQFGWRVDNLSFGSGYAFRLQTSAADGGFFRFASGSWSAFGAAYAAISAGAWYHVSVNLSSSNYAAAVNPGSEVIASDSSKLTEGGLVSHVHATGTDYYVVLDNIRVRKYSSLEPVDGGWYSEESQISKTSAVYVNTSTVEFVYVPYDSNLANCSIYGNFSGGFEKSQDDTSPENSQENLFYEPLLDGIYVWNVGCYDLSGRTSFAHINYAVKVDTTAPEYSEVSFAPPNLSVYNSTKQYVFNITWKDNFNVSKVLIETNLSGEMSNTTLYGVSGVYSFTAENISAGSYDLKWYAEDDVGNYNKSDVYIYNVLKANPLLNLYLNNLQNNISVTETTPVIINATFSSELYGYIELYLDGVLINEGQSPLTNITTISFPGIHNVSVFYLATQNYSSSWTSYYITVNDTIAPSVQLLSPKNNGFAGAGAVSLQYNVSDMSDIVSCSLYINGTLNQSNNSVVKYETQYFVADLEIGNYNWSISCVDNRTNTGFSNVRNFSVVDINTISAHVNTTKPQYEKGELAIIDTNVEDIYENALMANVTTYVIKGITSTSWWNESWKYRKQIIVNNSISRERIETIDLNISGLDGATSCDELRIVKNTTVNEITIHEVLPAEIIAGENISCIVRFNAKLEANMVNASNWFVYYGNPSASSQGVTVNKSGLWVQRGSVSGTTSSLTATIDNVPTDKTFVLHTQASGSRAATITQFTSAMSLTNEITFTRYGSGTSATVNWEAVTGSDFYVQRNTESFAAGTGLVTVTINSVNTSRSFIIVNGRVNSATTSNNNRGYFLARFINSTTIEIARGTTGTAAAASWQVVEWNNSKVYSGNVSFTGTSQTAATSSVNMSRAILLFGSTVAGSTGVGANMIMGNITSSNSLSFERTYASGTANVSWFVVELPQEFSVQNNSISMSSDQNIAINKVDYNKAFHVQSWSSTGTTSTTYTNAYILANLTNQTNLLLNKQTTTNTHIVRSYVVDTYSGIKGFGNVQELIQANTSQTDAMGYYTVIMNTSNLSYYNYSAVSVANKSGFINSTSYALFEIIPDKTAPNVTLESPEHLVERGVGYLNFSYIPYDINLVNCSIYINTNGTFNIIATNKSPLNNQTNSFNNIYVDLGLQDWNVGCMDEEKNLGFAHSNRTLNITGPDLKIRTVDLYFGDEERVEGVNITIHLNITNAGLTAVNNSFVVQFFKGDPDAGGTKIGNNITVNNISIGETITINTTEYMLSPGKNIIYARVDPDNKINETIESNNKANNNVSVVLYQYYYGNISGKIVVAGTEGLSLIDFKNATSEEGVLFFSDADSSFSFSDLQALTRNKLDQLVGDDFSNLDAAMNTSEFDDSIKITWGDGTDSPIQTKSFNISTGNIDDVPVVNSTGTSDFVTGILWDVNDDKGNLQYDAQDKEDIIFVSNVNPGKIGQYGVYDTEIRIPATLRNYKSGTDRIFLYVEIN